MIYRYIISGDFIYIGAGNIMVTAATELVGISFSKLKRFAAVLNLKFIDKSTFYRLRGAFTFVVNFARCKDLGQNYGANCNSF